MNRLTNLIRNSLGGIRKVSALVAMVWMVSTPALAQGVITGPSQTGVIQDLVGDGPGSVVISGVLYHFDNEITQFTLRGEEISDSDLELGMVVRFTIEDDILEMVEVLGPNSLIGDFDSH